ncbi:MAG: hypothetical protein MUF84_01825 [Anaerolineae bacterium]|nr:hypothetical protein [Anaerolineae bacterium]
MSVDLLGRPASFPNKISRILLLAVRDVLGPNGSTAVLTTAKLPHYATALPVADFQPGLTFVEVGRLFEALESVYGVQASDRLAKQAGRESFRYWIEGFGGLVGFADVLLRFLPLSARARIGVEVVAEIFNRYTDQSVALGESRERYLFTLETCGFCTGRRAEIPACGYVHGTLDELLFWISRGRRFAIEETACIALGDPVCTFSIDKAPRSPAVAK